MNVSAFCDANMAYKMPDPICLGTYIERMMISYADLLLTCKPTISAIPWSQRINILLGRRNA